MKKYKKLSKLCNTIKQRLKRRGVGGKNADGQ
jgi:hypothetical protein